MVSLPSILTSFLKLAPIRENAAFSSHTFRFTAAVVNITSLELGELDLGEGGAPSGGALSLTSCAIFASSSGIRSILVRVQFRVPSEWLIIP